MIEVPLMLLPVLLLVGTLAGLIGYSSARDRAYRDFVAARQRSIAAREDCQ